MELMEMFLLSFEVNAKIKVCFNNVQDFTIHFPFNSLVLFLKRNSIL